MKVALALAIAACLVLASGPASAVKIQVRGGAQLEAAGWADADGLVIRGQLLDDAGSPIPGGIVALRVHSLAAPRVAVALPAPRGCDPAEGGRGARRTTPEEYALEADERGEFCVRAVVALSGSTARLRFAAARLYEGTEKEVPIEDGAAQGTRTRISFEPAADVVDLDREVLALTASLRIDRGDPSRLGAAGPTKREGLAVILEDERGERLAQALTGGDGRARFEIKTAALAPPGPGELRLRFDGTPALARVATTSAVVRRADVVLTLAHPIATADPEDGVVVDVEASSSRGPVNGGVVEALLEGESVGAGEVVDGTARVVAAFRGGRAGEVPIQLRYVSAAPWWRAGPTLDARVSVAGPGVARQIVLGLVVLGIATWIVAGWRRAPKAAAPVDDVAGPPSGRAGVQVMRTSAGHTGWSGHVTDAHDGAPIADARLKIMVPAFDGDGVAALATTDGRGSFSLEGAHRSDARLVVESDTHSTYEQALPPSVMNVALVTRRRALVDRLVRWARRQGPPFDSGPEPTPGHVRRAAGRGRVTEVETWAGLVESAAFGPEQVDEQVEEQVRATEPQGKGGKPG